MTKEIEKMLEKYPLYSQDGKGEDAVVVCKFFAPIGSWTWYVLEGEKKEDGDWMFFGIVVNEFCTEMGYFTLKDLESIRLPLSLTIERDMYLGPCTVKELNLTDM